jgi:hypothetical protein
MNFTEKPRFKEPEEKRFSIIAYEFNNFPISTLDTDKEYYYIEPEEEYAAKNRLQRYLAEKLLNDDPIADYIMDILKDAMTEDGTLKELKVSDIEGRLF